jgi:hypothetical protein
MLFCWAESTQAVAAFCFAAPGQTEFYVLQEMMKEMNDGTIVFSSIHITVHFMNAFWWQSHSFLE